MNSAVSLFLLAASILVFCYYIYKSQENVLYLLLYLLYFSPLYKLRGSSLSLFGILILLYIAYNFQRIKNIKYLESYSFLLLYSLFVSLSTDLLVAFRVMMSFLFGYLILNDQKYDLNKIADFTASGIIVTSSLALFKDWLPALGLNLNYHAYRIGGELSYRFAGLMNNPNYYSIVIGLVISVYLLLILKNRIQKYEFAFLAALLYFGLKTISISLFVSIGTITLISLLLLLFKTPARFCTAIAFFIVCFIALQSFYLDNETIGMLLLRADIIEDSSSGMSEVTTGRSDIASFYISFFLENPISFLFGSGFSPVLINGRSTHNTYLEALFLLGVFGSIPYIYNYFNLFKTYLPNARYSTLGALPLAYLIIRYLARHLIQDEIHIFCIIICIISIKESFDSEQTPLEPPNS